MNDEINERIQKGVKWGSSRYDIDAGLLQDGYDPAQIESGWYTFEQPRPSVSQKSTKLPIIFGTAVIIILAALPFLASFLASIGGNGLLILLVIWMAFLCVITIIGYLKNSDLTKIK